MDRLKKKKVSTNLYSVTISPRYKTIEPVMLHEDYRIDIQKLFNRFSDRYQLIPEFDENVRLHYHGIVYVKDIIKMFRSKNKLDKTVGFVKYKKLNTFEDQLKWLMYCNKNYYKIKDYFDKIIFHPRKRINYKRLNIIKRLKQESQLNIIDFIEHLVNKEQ